MCLDVDNQTLYVLGRYLDPDARNTLFPLSPPVRELLTFPLSSDGVILFAGRLLQLLH